jgi:hypothetical protein
VVVAANCGVVVVVVASGGGGRRGVEHVFFIFSEMFGVRGRKTHGKEINLI